MIMALGMVHATPGNLTIAAGYESGHALVFQYSATSEQWSVVYTAQAHTQPILSLAIDCAHEAFFTSSADAAIAKHPLFPNPLLPTAEPLTVLQTKHAGQQGLTLRSDGKLLATAGWDARVRVYSAASMQELAVLKWHKEGCYAVAFAAIRDEAKADLDRDGFSQAELTTTTTTTTTAPLVRGAEQRRIDRAKETHWIAVGSKDGKVSLWDIY